MSGDLGSRVTQWALPAVAVLFVGLYAMHLLTGADPETALIQAGAAGLIVAVLIRLAVRVIENSERAAEAVDLGGVTNGESMGTSQGMLTATEAESTPGRK
jgi:hypothetical protein